MTTINTTTADTYELPSAEEPVSAACADAERSENRIRCPRILWAGLSIFACNLLVFCGIALSPELKVGVYGQEHGTVHASDKPSPFMETVDTRKHTVKLAQRLQPVIVQEAPVQEAAPAYVEASVTNSTDLTLPRASQTTIPVRRASETTLVIHRASESGLAVPRSTSPNSTLN